MPPVLFLDFDGVLHSTGGHAGFVAFTQVPLLEAMLREPACAGVKVVISSTWREVLSLPKLRLRFSADIGRRIVGVTPTLDDYDGAHARCWEIKAWLALHPDVEHFAVLDDLVDAFPVDWHHNVVFTDGAVGLTATDLVRLRALLARAAS